MGKGVEAKTSRIFHQCYVKCCKLQNLMPLTNVCPSQNGKNLDFCVDRIKYVEWAPILNALSCDLSLHSVSIRCRQQVKTVLEHTDCERLAKTVTKRAVILTNFMLNNLIEAICQLLNNSTLLETLCLEGLPLKIPYLNPLNDAFLSNSSLQHLYLPRCLIGDAGCQALCKAVRGLPNILTLDLSGCDLTLLGASYIAELMKYQKIHRYSENWVHTLRYRTPELDAMGGLRRISLCANQCLGDAGIGKLLEVLADDLWIKALDIQNCGASEVSANNALMMLRSNTTLVVLDLRYNSEVSSDSLSKIRTALRANEQTADGQFVWLNNVSSTTDRLGRPCVRNNYVKDRKTSNTQNPQANKYQTKTNLVGKDKDYTELLAQQLQEEIAHRQQLEELNMQLVQQLKEIKQQHIRMWANETASSGSQQSLETSGNSCDVSSSSVCSSSVPIDQNTLSYIQQAFKDIYGFIKNNQCTGCEDKSYHSQMESHPRAPIVPKKAQSVHVKVDKDAKRQKSTKSAHILGEAPVADKRQNTVTKLKMLERNIGDTNMVEPESFDHMFVGQETSKKPRQITNEWVGDEIDHSDAICSNQQSEDVQTYAVNPLDALETSSDDDDDT